MSRQRMRGADAAWLHMDSAANPMVITSVLWTDDPIDWGAVEKVIIERLVDRYPRFRQIPVDPRLGAGTPRWVDDPRFDPTLHLHHVALPAPGDRRALGAFVSDVMSTPLPVARPLWQAYLVDGFDGGSAVITRIHHCVADGIALMRVLLSLADGAKAAETDADEERSLLGEALHRGRALADPRRLAAGALHAAGEVAAIGRILALPTERRTFPRRLDGVKQAAWSAPLPLAAIKAAGAEHGATVNDVLLSMVAGTLRRQLPADLPSVRALVPFNVRASLDAPVPKTLGNEFGMLFIDLPVGIDHPMERLLEVKRRMDELKASPEGAAGFHMLGVMGVVPLQVLRLMVAQFASKGSLVLTNVPGPRAGVSIAGTPVRGVLAWVPQSGDIGLGLSLISYDGSVVFGAAADRAVLPDPQAVVDGFEDQLEAVVG
jgi:diacylglycerol O-acyltransferase / wax synthase